MKSSEKLGYSFDRDLVSYILNDVKKRCIDIYPIIKFEYVDDDYNSGVKPVPSLRPRSHPEFSCKIGRKDIFDHIQNNMVRDVDLVKCVKHMFHESCHLYRSLYTYQSDNISGIMLDQARMEAVGSVFRGYYLNTYGYNLSEIDVDEYGIKHTVDYFDHYILDDNGEPIVDVGSCVLQALREMPGDWHGNKYSPTYEKVMQSLNDAKLLYQYADRNVIFLEQNKRDVSSRNMLMEYPGWRKIIMSDDRRGVAYDEKLFAMSLDVSTYWIDTHKCMKEEVKRVRDLYPSQKARYMQLFDRTASMFNRLDQQSESGFDFH